MKRIAFATFGCRVNRYETEAMRLSLLPSYQYVPLSEEADIYIINTCTVTSRSDHKSRQLIRSIKRRNPSAMIVVTGCYPQRAPDEVLSIEGVSLVLGNDEKGRVKYEIELDGAPSIRVGDICKKREYSSPSLNGGKPLQTRPFVKIQDGCDRFCYYCIVPYVRGRARGRPLSSIMDEIRMIASMGFKEVVLCGINIGTYHVDGVDLPGLLRRIMDVDGIERVRLSSLEPDTIGDGLIELFLSNKKLCPHIHLSLQTGDQGLLRRMGRHYTIEEIRDVVNRLREGVPDISITSDVMVGFPGEDDRSFLKTYDFIKEIDLSSIHIFRYSKRPGTISYSFKESIPPRIKQERARRLALLSKELNLRYRMRFLGRETTVLIEDGRSGLMPNYIRVSFDEDLPKGSIIKARIIDVRDEVTVGKRI